MLVRQSVAAYVLAIGFVASLTILPDRAVSGTPPEGEGFFFTPRGFDREGKPIQAAGPATGRLKITVRDAATGRPTFCRINVVGPDGNFYQLPDNYLSPYALTGQWPKPGQWGNRTDKAPYRYLGRFFYSWGETEVAVPAGPVRVEVWKGYEYRPQSITAQAVAGASRAVEVTLTRTAALAPLGYYSGDPHLHVPRRSERDEGVMFDLLEAEDIRFGSFLGYNEPAGPYSGFMDRMDVPQQRGLGARSARSRGGYHLMSGQEYRSSTYGHLLLYLLDDLVLKGQSLNANNWPVYGEVGREALANGGIAIQAHGGYAQEVYSDAALGTVSAVELLQFGVYRGIGLTDWYHMLNTGYRFPCTGASDWPACRFLGDCRTCVYHDTEPTFPDWLRGAAAGRSFVTTGPLLLLEVDGQKPGARLNRNGPGPHAVTARVRVRCEVTPVAQVELIVNGQVARRLAVPADRGQGQRIELSERLELTESAWIAARAWSNTLGGRPDAEAHTNPVYVYLNGRAPYRAASLDAWVERIDAQIVVQRKRTFSEKARVLDYFQRARDVLLTIRQQGGLSADADPAELARNLPGPGAGTGLAADASLRLPTEEELKTFLKPVPPKAPQEALKTFETVDGFQMQLVAAEPLVASPVAAAFDEDGNLYVCEMRDYPFKPPDGQPPLGAIRLLKDLDGDGVYETSTVFADRLLWAAGVAPWKGGVFVAASPDIWYLKDTDGDGKADIKVKVFTGFGTENQQAMLNNLVWGLDHKVYGSTAGNGGLVRPANDTATIPIDVKGRDFRFDPVSGAFETITGTVQFGNTFDDWGNRFVCSESRPLLHVVLPQRYLARNPYLPVPAAIHNAAPGPVPVHRISPVERWRQIRSSRRIAAGERSAESPGASHHVIDAGAGVTVYRGGAYPSGYDGTVFTADGQNNLIHHRRLVPDGVTFTSRRVEEKTEFVRSSDLWFRPVNFVNAPDGTLWCLDMNREILESIHIPLDVVKHLDLTSGRDHGRIYRIAPPGFRVPPAPRLGRATTAELVAALASPHGWWRDTAHRLLYERQDQTAVPALRRLVRESTLPQARLLALWSLQGLNALDTATLLVGLADAHPGVRENAVRLAEPRLDLAPDLLTKVIALADDPDARVRFQVAFTLGESKDPRAATTLAAMARRHAGDVWMRTAVLSSVAESADRVLVGLLDDKAWANSTAGQLVLSSLAQVIGVRNRPQELNRVLTAFAASPAVAGNTDLTSRLVLAVGTGLKRSGGRFRLDAAATTPGAKLIRTLADAARNTAVDARTPEPARREAVQLLSCLPYAASRPTLVELLDPGSPPAMQAVAVRALADYAEPEVSELLVARWGQYTPEVRQEAVQALFAREDRTLALLRAAVRGEVSVAEIDLSRRDLLRTHRNAAVRELAAKLFGQDTSRPRAAVIAEYQPALSLKPDPTNGRKVFEKNCMACHQVGDQGAAVGPSLASSSFHEPAALLTHILDPNLYVAPNYVQYVVTDRSGRTFTGVIASQTATGITLKRDQGMTDTILRADIDEVHSTGRSLMPEGLEGVIGKQEMADLIGFLVASVVKPGVDTRERDFGTLPGLVEPGVERKKP